VEACSLLDCGPRGECALRNDEAVCACDEGYAGDDCSECAPGYRFGIVPIGQPVTCVLDEPATTNMVLWLDADHDDSFVTNASGVVSWASRAPGDATLFTTGGNSAFQPRRVSPTRGARSVVRFDGTDDRLRRFVDLRSPTYSIFVVAKASGTEAGEQMFLFGSGETNVNRSLRLVARSNASNLLFRHGMPGGSDELVVDPFATASMRAMDAHRATILNGTGIQVFDGAQYDIAAAAQAQYDERLMLTLGRPGDATHSVLEGDIAEVLIFAPAIGTTQGRAGIRAYLTAKWGL
jgi:hypothetical protein